MPGESALNITVLIQSSTIGDVKKECGICLNPAVLHLWATAGKARLADLYVCQRCAKILREGWENHGVD